MATANRIYQVFTFVDRSGADFHLAEADLGARGHAGDLTAHAVCPVPTDFDGHLRLAEGGDIGADQSVYAPPPIDESKVEVIRATGTIYRSLTTSGQMRAPV